MTVPALVISPHLDDGVLSCGDLLLAHPGSVVATVMAGDPGPGVLSDWDRGCGFVDGDDPVGRRREEDRAALDLVGARPWHLDFLDLPYREKRAAGAGGAVDAVQVATQLVDVVAQLAPARLLIPLGLLHPDHVLTHEAGVLLLQRARVMDMWAYLDLPYGFAHPELVTSRLDGLRRHGIDAQPVPAEPPSNAHIKRDAIALYSSQVAPVMDDHGRDAWERTMVEGSERFWQLTKAEHPPMHPS